MMNRFEGPGAREARIRYLDGDFQVTSPGAFVRCAVTGETIPLDELQILERRAAGALCQRRRLAAARDRDQSGTAHDARRKSGSTALLMPTV